MFRLQLNSYDHHAAIYLLLLERLRHRSQAHEATVAVTAKIGAHDNGGSSRRRPSSIAEQAMRKLGINSHAQLTNHHHAQQQQHHQQHQHQQHQQIYQQQLATVGHITQPPSHRSESPLSPRHAPPTLTVMPNAAEGCAAIDSNISPLPSPGAVSALGHHHMLGTAAAMLPLRESNIREPAPASSIAMSQLPGQLRDSAYFRGSTLANSGSGVVAHTASTFTMRGDCASPYAPGGGGHSYLGQQYGSMLGARENSCLLARDAVGGMAHRTPSSRFLTNGLDQRIIKQSTEDCRRLLQQVSAPPSVDAGIQFQVPPIPSYRQPLSRTPVVCRRPLPLPAARHTVRWMWELCILLHSPPIIISIITITICIITTERCNRHSCSRSRRCPHKHCRHLRAF